MTFRRISTLTLVSVLLMSLLVVGSAGAAAGRFTEGTLSFAPGGRHRYLVVAKSAAEYDRLRSDVVARGGTIIKDLRAINTLVVSGSSELKARVAASPHAKGVAKDRINHVIRPTGQADFYNIAGERQRIRIGANAAAQQAITPDPSFALPGLMWNVDRINAPAAWDRTSGDPAVLVGVADTGLDYTHAELAPQVVHVEDFTLQEDPPLCKTFFGLSDQELADEFGGPADTDWHGHGSWIGGNIAATLDGMGTNGIAPNIKLVALKISGWCGSAYSTTEMEAFLYAADHGIDVVSISFGGYLDRSDPDQELIYQQYLAVVAYARSRGTVIVASSGNDHVRVGRGGQVISHGPLTIPGEPFEDLFGTYETPGGIPGVVFVAATNNVVNSSSPSCAPADANSPTATCKPASDAHQPFGVGEQDQLAYYSNYGPRIDVAAPGGARKFNLPNFDRGGTPGWPVTTADGYNAWQTFSITSNWATGIPCYLIDLPGFAPDQCYSTIQGTSMATPHVSAVLALIASAEPALRHRPGPLIQVMKDRALKITGNTTPPLSASDTSPGDLTGVACTTGYCHLGGAPIPDSEAYGAGLVDARAALEP